MFKLLFNLSMLVFTGAKNITTKDQYKPQPAKIPMRFTDQYKSPPVKIPMRFTDQYSDPKPLPRFGLLNRSKYF